MTVQPGPYAAPSTKPSKRTVGLLVALVIGLAIAAAGQLIHVPYVVFSPGPAQDTLGKDGKNEVISIDGTKTYPTSGTLDFTTVSLYGGPDHPVSLWRYLRAKADSNSEIAPEKEIFGDQTGAQIKQQSAAQMTGSQQSAEVVAIRAAGAKVGEKVYVGAVGEGQPAAGKLKVNDYVRSLNGTPTPSMASVRAVIGKVKPGDTVKVVIRRGSKDLTVPIKTATGDNGRAVIGIQMDPRFTFPYKVKINAGEVGGPSAGLMFSLAIYDKLTPGELTAGKKFAGTGEIDTLGVVGPIGGIRQKLVGARESGADYFLSPAQNCPEVKGHVPDGLTVIKVGTFDQARSAVQKVADGKTSNLPAC